MSTWDYNCPQYVDFANLQEDISDGNEEYFDVDHEFADIVVEKRSEVSSHSAKKEMPKLVVNLCDVLLSGAATASSSASRKRRSYEFRRTAARQKGSKAKEEDVARKKLKTGTPGAPLAPIILQKSASRLRAESVDRSLSLRRSQVPKAEGRKRHASDTRKSPTKKDDRTKGKKLTLTQVQPFHFATDDRIKGVVVDPYAKDGRKRKREDVQPYVSLAEQVLAFQNQMPDRYKSSTRASGRNSQNTSLKLTRPMTPQLRTKLRSRPVYCASQEEKEEEELKEIHSHQFRAKPFNSRIMIHTLGIPMVKSKSPTKPLDVQLATDRRADAWKKNENQEAEMVFHFKAKPAPKNVSKGPMRAKPLVKITEPKSPAFALKLRSQVWQRQQEELMAAKEEEEEAMKNAEPRKMRSSSIQPPVPKGPTMPVPFSFDDFDKERFAKKEEKIKKLIEKENMPHLFHANPMPSPSLSQLPPKPEVTITQPEPFQMRIEQRVQERVGLWHQELEEQTKKMKEAMKFKAQPCTVLSKEPFIPERNCRPLTECSGIVLNTEKRASVREQYDEKRRQYQMHLDAIKLQNELENEREEQKELAKLRSEATHKAHPAPKFNHPIQIKPSEKPLTMPKSPKFSNRLRSAR